MLLGKHKVRVIINENDRSRFEYMLEQLQFLIREIEASPLELTVNLKDFDCVITVSKQGHFELLLDVLQTNRFGIHTNDKKVQEILKKLENKTIKDISEFAASIEVKKNVNKIHPSIDKLVAEGNYIELCKVVKDITYTPETILRARSGLSLAITNSIIKTIESVSNYKIDIDEAVKNLFAIAIDNELNYLKQDELMLQAANVAFEICIKDADSITNLIKIANKKNVDYLLNLKAAAKFSEIALADENKYKMQLKFATRELNTRWLTNLLELTSDKLNDEELQEIDRLITYTKNYFTSQF